MNTKTMIEEIEYSLKVIQEKIIWIQDTFEKLNNNLIDLKKELLK